MLQKKMSGLLNKIYRKIFFMHTNNQQAENKNEGSEPGKNGVVTVNDGNNPTPDERDSMIGTEKDTERLRSERESVQEADSNPK